MVTPFPSVVQILSNCVDDTLLLDVVLGVSSLELSPETDLLSDAASLSSKSKNSPSIA